jgi:phage-related protein
METFPNYQPIYGGQGDVTPKVLVSPFGDNYSQRTGDGLNALDETWPLTFTELEQAGFEEIMDFLESHGGYKAFFWTIPRNEHGFEVDRQEVVKTASRRGSMANRYNVSTGL